MMSDYFPDSVGFQTIAYVAGRLYFPFSVGKTESSIVTVASIAVLLFDFIITFDSEVRWTWGRGWGITRIIFVVSRYVPFVGLVMTVYYSVGSTHGGIPDHGIFTAVYDSVRWLGIAASELLLVLRTYVVWGCDKRFLILTLFFTTAVSVVVLVIADVGASESGDSTGVFEEGRDSSIVYGLLMLVELVLMMLTLYKRFKSFRSEGSPLVTTLCRDGVAYILCITLVSMANCISIVLLPLSRRSPQLVTHSVLASRLLFNLRAMPDLQDVVTDESTILGVVSQHMAFQTPPCTDHTELWDFTDC
ncbi:uncharacterized protein BJ212DRAFT_1588956 [Suillus subaureus]|uniref:DUF6533 domain-containing protein n=1 Tax=Suillus subaureus TaxID=48587 RepID=A0A9P7JB97_9AGAM|nr:uncharacterized protein BJ212DRAFT_1588956 [Suillus subaureus]KAG1812426.1 hypothetical protein BJ212DRAFT_1588956 [Suillus subaureus]